MMVGRRPSKGRLVGGRVPALAPLGGKFVYLSLQQAWLAGRAYSFGVWGRAELGRVG
jgi:hypothetical protein